MRLTCFFAGNVLGELTDMLTWFNMVLSYFSPPLQHHCEENTDIALLQENSISAYHNEGSVIQTQRQSQKSGRFTAFLFAWKTIASIFKASNIIIYFNFEAPRLNVRQICCCCWNDCNQSKKKRKGMFLLPGAGKTSFASNYYLYLDLWSINN